MSTEKTPRQLIAEGICQSPLTTDRCPYCVDTCEAFQNKHALQDTKARLRDLPIGAKYKYRKEDTGIYPEQ